MSEDERLAARRERSLQAKAWIAEHPEQFAAMRAKGWASYAGRHPERAAAYSAIYAALEAGEIEAEPCAVCGGEGRPYLDLETHELIGWRCLLHRKASDG